MEDAELLLRWRNDPVTRQNSINTSELALADHLTWLQKVLANPKRQLLVAMVDQRPVGTIRADQDIDDSIQLSWTIAPDERGHGFGQGMVKAATKLFAGSKRLVAKIKSDNIASLKIVQSLGFTRQPDADGLTIWYYLI